MDQVCCLARRRAQTLAIMCVRLFLLPALVQLTAVYDLQVWATHCDSMSSLQLPYDLYSLSTWAYPSIY